MVPIKLLCHGRDTTLTYNRAIERLWDSVGDPKLLLLDSRPTGGKLHLGSGSEEYAGYVLMLATSNMYYAHVCRY